MSTPTTKRLLLKCPLPIRQAHTAVADECFETISSLLYLKLYMGRGKYTPTVDAEGVGYQDLLSGTLAPIDKGRVGFEAVIEQNFEVMHLVEHLRRNCLSTDKKIHTPLEVWDFVHPQWNDRQLYNGEYYTRRLGRIISVQSQGASIGLGSTLYGDGFTIRFKELKPRIFG
jgi:hypothetical protein